MTKKQNTQVKKVMDTLHGQKFYDFYREGATWDKYVETRPANKKLTKEIQEEIKNLFNIK